MGLFRRLQDAVFGRRSREIWKLKSLLGLTVSRLAVLRKQRHARCFHARSDLIQLLLLGQQDRALIRAELMIREQNMVDVFAMVESYCHLLNERAFLIHQQKECPEELREATAGLVFAASRCGDLPELKEVQKIFSSRFGKEYTAAAAELRSNCGVNFKMVQKFSARQPSLESRVNVIKQVAMERGIKLEDITNSFSEASEVDENPNLWSKNQAEEMVTPQLDSACDGDDKVKLRSHEFKDVVSAAQAAFKSAAYAAVAARAAVELFNSESERKGSCNESNSSCIKKKEPEDHTKHLVGKAVREKMQHIQASKWQLEQEMNQSMSRDEHFRLASSSIDNGFSKSQVRSPEMDLEKSREEGILLDESQSETEEHQELEGEEQVQEKSQFHADQKNQVHYPYLNYQKRSTSKDEEDADSFSSYPEMEVRIPSVCSSPGKNLAADFSAMGKNPNSVRTPR